MTSTRRALLFWGVAAAVGCGSTTYDAPGADNGDAAAGDASDDATLSDDTAAPDDAAGDTGDAAEAGPRSYADTVLEDAPIAYWRFESADAGAVGDVTGHGHVIALSDAGASLGASAALTAQGKGLVLDGVSGYAHVPIADTAFEFPGTKTFTLEAWVDPASLTDSARVFSNDSVADGYALYADEAGVVLTRKNATFDSGARTTPLAVGKFAHVVATYDGARARLYVNGAVQDEKDSGTSVLTALSALTIGARADGLQYFFQGTLDEAAIYDKALTPARIKAHFDASKH